MKLTLKIAKYFFISLILLILLTIGILVIAVKTETGSRYLLSVIPGLAVTDSKGTLSGGWSAKELIWQNDGIKIAINNPSLDWYISCLLKANVCIDKLTINQVAVNLLENKDDNSDENTSDNTPIQLPTINLPVSIHIKNIELDKFIINNQEVISIAKLSNLNWHDTDIQFDSLTLYNDQAKADISSQGHIQLANDWPLNISGQIQLDKLLDTPWLIKLDTQGELQKQLTLNIISNGYLQATLKGSAAPLKENLPADITLNINDFFPSNIKNIPKSLTIKQLKLTAKGDLTTGFNIENNATLMGQTTPVSFILHGLLTDKKLDLQKLLLNTTEQQFVSITGQTTFQPDLQANVVLNYQHFPWQQLYPIDPPPPVDLKTLQATFTYQNNSYQSDLKADLTGPAGDFTVNSKLLGDLQQLTLETLQINTPNQGNIAGTAKLTFDPTITWLADLNLKSINPNYWLTELSGQLNGNIHSVGKLAGESIETDTTIDIKGTLQNQPTQIKSKILAKQQQWDIPELLVKVGNNHITGKAQLNKTIQANVDLNIPNLSLLLPELSGNLTGNIQLNGSVQQPHGNLKLAGQRLTYQQQGINQLQLEANLTKQQQATINLSANRIRSGTTSLGNLEVNGNGNIKSQQLNLQLSGGIVKLITAISSQQDQQQNWQVNINKLQLASQGQDWQLQNTAKLQYSSSGTLTLNSHCFKNGQATLCALEQQQLLPEIRINYRLANFALESLKPWYPENFNWKGILSATVSLKLPNQGPIGKIEINANKGIFQLRENTDENWHDLPYQKLNLQADLTPNKITSNLEFKGNDLGNLHSQLIINPLANNKPISGNFNINNFNINIFQPFVPNINQLTGLLNGQGNITGFLEKPHVSGKVTLTKGTVLGDTPVSLEQLQATALIEGENLKLNGSWKSGKTGNATLKGDVAWGDNFNLKMAIQAKDLPVIIAPHGSLEAGANLQINMNTQLINVSGVVEVPRGAIKIRELPPSTVTLSSDAVIVTQQAAESENAAKLNMDLDVLIGSERLSLQGFGLTSDIKGNLKITRDLFTQGSVSLTDGTYRAYGQKLDIRKARIFFTGALTEPHLDIEAVRVADDVTAGVRVKGSTNKPTIEIFSTPPMNQDQALSYIIFGRPLTAGDNSVLAQAAIALGVASGSGIAGQVAEKVGIKDFQLDATGSGDETKVMASGKITDRLSIHYGVGIFDAMNTLMLRYKLTKAIYLEAANGTANSLDVFYKKSFK